MKKESIDKCVEVYRTEDETLIAIWYNTGPDGFRFVEDIVYMKNCETIQENIGDLMTMPRNDNFTDFVERVQKCGEKFWKGTMAMNNPYFIEFCIKMYDYDGK